MACSGKDAEADRLVREPTEASGESVTEPVRSPARVKPTRGARRRERGSFERIEAIVRAYNAKPVRDPRTPEEMLYGERGLPA